LLAVLVIAGFQGSTGPDLPAADDSFARAFIDTLHTGLPSEAARSLSPRLARVTGIEDSLAHAALQLPLGAIDSTALVEATLLNSPFSGDGAQWRRVIYDVRTSGGYARVRLVVADELGHHFIDGFGVQRFQLAAQTAAVPNAPPRTANESRSHTASFVSAALLVLLAIAAMFVLRKPIVTR
jgi:hypothetical protein